MKKNKNLLVDLLELLIVFAALSIDLWIVFSGIPITPALLFLGVVFIVVFAFASTHLIKRHFDSQTYWVLSIVRFKKTVPFIKKFSFASKFLQWCSVIGLILGFGVIAVDFLFAREKRGLKRALILIVAFSLLYSMFSAVSVFIPFSESPFTVGFGFLYPFAFALFGLSGFAILALADQGFHILFRMLNGKPSCPGVMPVIPGIQIPKAPVFIPAYVWIVLFVILIIHELSHGIVALKEKIKINSSGLLLFGVIPIGAFVEPDEKKLESSPPKKQLMIYSAGPSANIVSIVPFLLVWLLFANFYMAPALQEISTVSRKGIDHVEIIDVSKEITVCQEKEPSPSYGVLKKGMQVLELNGTKINSVEDFVKIMAPIRSNSIKTGLPATIFLKVKTAEGKTEEKEITLSKRFKFAGFTVANINKEGFSMPPEYIQQFSIIQFVNGFLLWLVLFSFLLAVVNFLPVPFFDGGRIVPLLLLPYFASKRHPIEKTKKAISVTFFMLMVLLLTLNALPFSTF